MKNKLLLVFAWIATLHGEIRETARIGVILDEVQNCLPEETLVICDIDNTLLKASQYLGSIEWSDHVKALLEADGMSKKEAARIENILWRNVQPHISVELVDPETTHIIKRLMEKGVFVLGLTARTPEEADYSLEQLHSLDIDLEGPFVRDVQLFRLESNALYKNGVLFSTPLNKKSEVLLAFLKKNKLFPKRVVFIDDKFCHVQDVIHALEKRDISCLGLWFNPPQSAR